VTALLGLLLAAAVQAAPARAAAQAPAIPANPEALVFKPLAYTPPRAADHRVVLKNGMVVFIAEDPTLPLVDIALTVRTGGYLDPAGRRGWPRSRDRSCATAARARSPPISSTSGWTSWPRGSRRRSARRRGRPPLNCLAENLDDSLRLFVQVLKEPRFQEDRLALSKDQALQEMTRRNDDPEDIERREWNVLLYGEGRATNRFTTEASIRSVTRPDLVAFHRRYFPSLGDDRAVSGRLLAGRDDRKLEAAFAGWPGAKPQVPPVPSEIATAAPGLYRIEKEVPQGRVSIGLPAVKRDSPDIYALEVMNEILGGGGFVSRITRTVRSNEGLAYSAGSAPALRHLLSRRLPRPLPVQEPDRCPTPRSSCWTRSRRCASSR
jgi:predicted Zn-dependent peptidase